MVRVYAPFLHAFEWQLNLRAVDGGGKKKGAKKSRGGGGEGFTGTFGDVETVDDLWGWSTDLLLPLLWVGDCKSGCNDNTAVNYDPRGQILNEATGFSAGLEFACTDEAGECLDDGTCSFCGPGTLYTIYVHLFHIISVFVLRKA